MILLLDDLSLQRKNVIVALLDAFGKNAFVAV